MQPVTCSPLSCQSLCSTAWLSTRLSLVDRSPPKKHQSRQLLSLRHADLEDAVIFVEADVSASLLGVRISSIKESKERILLEEQRRGLRKRYNRNGLLTSSKSRVDCRISAIEHCAKLSS